MKHFITSCIIAALSFAASAADHCAQLVAYGYPTTTQVQQVTPLCRIAYYTLHDDQHKVPAYSAEWLLPENLDGKNPRIDSFKADPNVLEQHRAKPEDYANTGYDKGHMAPVEDMRKDSVAMLQSFYMSNMVPQNPQLNRVMWRMLETHVRKLAAAHATGIYVVTGSVFKQPVSSIADGVGVPAYVFKVVIDKAHGQGIGYLVPNTAPGKGAKYQSYAVPIKDVEVATGINFTPANPTAAFKAVASPELQ
jgi:endonuclease G